jgi:hypothetical protein
LFDGIFDIQEPVLDPTLGDPLARKLLDSIKQGNIDAVLKDLDTVRAGRWDDRNFYVWLVGNHLADTGSNVDLPDTASGNLIKGNIKINLAWKARGGAVADKVTEEGWKQFFAELDQAGRHLVRAGEQDPEDPTPFASLQPVAMGLQLERKFAVAWLDEALRRDPTHQGAHQSHLTLLCEKWGGSHEEMFAFARDTLRKLPPGAKLGAILYDAFLEYFNYFRLFEPDDEKLLALRSSPKVREESLAVYRTFLEKRNIEGVSDYYFHNLTIWWFDILDVPPVVRQEAKKIGPHVTRWPWKYFSRDPVQAYQRAVKR